MKISVTNRVLMQVVTEEGDLHVLCEAASEHSLKKASTFERISDGLTREYWGQTTTTSNGATAAEIMTLSSNCSELFVACSRVDHQRGRNDRQ